ncbi:MAG: molybdopterin-dependent oxidoreductase [Pseudomonadota bacterium]
MGLLLALEPLWGLSHSAVAGDPTAVHTPILLTVAGKIAAAGETAQFDRSRLESLGMHHLKTHTYWTDGVQDFEGVLLRDLLRAVGSRGKVGVMEALNDYSVEIPLSDAAFYDVLIALKRNGRDLRIRDRGPLWLVYPIDGHPELDRRATADKMIWHLSRINIQ